MYAMCVSGAVNTQSFCVEVCFFMHCIYIFVHSVIPFLVV